MFRRASAFSRSFARSLRSPLATSSLARSGSSSSSTLRNLAFGAGAGIVGVAVIGLVSDSVTNSATEAASSSSTSFKDPVKRRLRGAYGYVAASLAGTAVAAGYFFRSGLAYRVMSMNPIVVGLGSMAGLIGTMYLTRSIDYHTSPVAKHLALGSFVALQAVMMAPLAALGGPLLLRAAVATGVIVGGVSLTAATAPSQAYMSMAGPLSIGCGVILAASLGSMFFPSIPMLYNVVLYGGLALHGGMIFYRTQNLIDGAERFPKARFDPINDSLGIYIDSLAIFWRMAQIMSGSGNRRK